MYLVPVFASTFRSLRHRNYRLYFTGQVISFTGSWMQSAALMWLVFDTTSDPLWPALILVAQVGPTLLFGPLGGALADRMSKQHLIVLTQSFFLVSATILTTLVASQWGSPWLFFGITFLNGLVQSLDLPARLAFVPELIPKQDLINAVSLNSLAFNVARATGPALAGLTFLLTEWIVGEKSLTVGATACFLINAISYVAVIVAIRRITIAGRPMVHKVRSSIFDGIRYLRQRTELAWLLIITGGLCIFGWPALSLFPAYTKFVLKHAEKEYSLLVSALGLGALAAALGNARFGSVERRKFALCLGAGGSIVGLFGMSQVSEMFPAMAFASCLGFGLILYLSTGQSVFQLSVPYELRGRVLAYWAMTLSASAPLGHLASGFAAQRYNVADVMLVSAIGVSVGSLALVVWCMRTTNTTTEDPSPVVVREVT